MTYHGISRPLDPWDQDIHSGADKFAPLLFSMYSFQRCVATSFYISLAFCFTFSSSFRFLVDRSSITEPHELSLGDFGGLQLSLSLKFSYTQSTTTLKSNILISLLSMLQIDPPSCAFTIFISEGAVCPSKTNAILTHNRNLSAPTSHSSHSSKLISINF